MKRLLCLASLITVCGVPTLHAADIPPGQAALFATQDKVKGASLEEIIKIYQEDVINKFPGSLYAGQALLNIGSEYLKRGKHDKALELTEQALKEYGNTYLASQAVRRKFAILLYGLDKPQEALDFLDEAMPQYGNRIPSRDKFWLPVYRYDAHKKLGDQKAALEVLQKAIVSTPEVLDSWEFHRRYIIALRSAGKRREVQAAAKGAYACCKFAEADITKMADLVVKSFVTAAEVFKANQFLAAQEDPEKKNPLQDVPWPKIANEEDWKALLDNCHNNEHLWIVALLYFGDYDQALEMATARLGEAGSADTIAACIGDIARCFKAKDLNLVRANQFIKYAKEGEGENPLLDF